MPLMPLIVLLPTCYVHIPLPVYLSIIFCCVFKAHPVNGAAVFPYESKSQQNLSFQEGDIITLLEAR